jgi:hypothetical protein
MKIKILMALLLLVGMFACTQRTCPTYTKDSKPEIQKSEKPSERV